MSYKIGIDISGGDFAPQQIIEGAIVAQAELKENIVLIGVEEEIRRELKRCSREAGNFTIVDAPEKIDMGEAAATSVRRKKNSSIVVGTRLLAEGAIDAFVSCGNTGAVVCAATLGLGLIEGVERPGIGLVIPSKTGVSLIIDVGANIDCKPLHLFQYGIMAAEYYSLVFNKENPTIGLLNIGEEASKGLGVIKTVYKLFAASPLNFAGNAEAKEIFSGKFDCIICDGFVGNITLKVAEGTVEFMGKFLVETVSKSALGRLGLLLAKKNLLKFKRSIDYAEYGGAPLLGVNGVVIIGHGRSNNLAVKNAIKVAVKELKRDINSQIKGKIHEICKNSWLREVFTS